MREKKIDILCTGALDESLAEQVRVSGLGMDVIPFIETQPVSPGRLREQVMPLLQQKAAVIFTSGNAITAVASCLNGALPQWTIYCLGHNTRRLAEKYFGDRAIAGVADDGESLGEVIIEKNKIEPVIFFCGDQRRQELPDMLELAGTIVREVIVYRTVACPVRIEKTYDGILFFSPSAVQNFFSLNQVNSDTLFFSIGPTTSKLLKVFSQNKIIQARTPEKEELVKEVIEYFKN